MIVKGKIKSIDYNSNTCIVELPTFRSAAGGETPIAPAIFSIAPGVYNGYKEDDCVLVAFENGQLQNPCVIGKLYLGADTESQDPRGSINCTTLVTTNTNSLPLSTKIESDDTTISVSGTTTTYKTLKDVIDNLVKLNTIAGGQVYNNGTTLCIGPVTNIYEYTMPEYTSVYTKVIGGKNFYQIYFNESIELTDEQVKQYMQYMTGKSVLPGYYSNQIYSGVFMSVSQQIYYPVWDKNAKSLRLYIIKEETIEEMIKRLIEASGNQILVSDLTVDPPTQQAFVGADEITATDEQHKEIKALKVEVEDLSK